MIRAIDKLGDLGPTARPAIPALSALAKGEASSLARNRGEEIRQHAITALYQIDPNNLVLPESMRRRYGFILTR